MQTRALKTLLRISQVGTFAAAADALNMTVSAVSMQIKALETELGVSLFDRAHRPPQLTPIGREVCDRATRIVAEEQAMIETCRTGHTLSGTFRIGFVATASVRLLPGFLAEARLRAPEARFDVETDVSEALEGKLLSGRIDAAVVTALPEPNSGLHYIPLRRERMVWVAPKNVADSKPQTLFATLPFFHFLPRSGIGRLIATQVARHAHPEGRVLYLDNVEAIMECVNAGLGFTLLPEPDVKRTAGPEARILADVGPDVSPVIARDLALAVPTRGGSAARADELAALFAPAPT